MKEINEKEEKFYSKWKEKRNKKFQFMFLHGTVYWGIPTGILFFLSESHFTIENMNLARCMITLTIFGIGGLFFGLIMFKGNDNRYLAINEDDKILYEIRILTSGKVWNYENIVFYMEDNETLLAKNNLLWLNESNASYDNFVDYFNIVLKDLEQLKKNTYFELFTRVTKVKVQIYSNSYNEIPLIELDI